MHIYTCIVNVCKYMTPCKYCYTNKKINYLFLDDPVPAHIAAGTDEQKKAWLQSHVKSILEK